MNKNKLYLIYFLVCIILLAISTPPAAINPQRMEPNYKALLSKRIKPRVGIGAYAIRHENWECDKFLKYIDNLKYLHLAVLWDTFGSNNDCLLNMMHDPRLLSLELHLINECCIRNANCSPHEFLSGLRKAEYERALVTKNKKFLRKMKKYFKYVNNFLKKNLQLQTQCYISPGLESNLSTRAARIVSKIVKKSLPSCLVVFNPLKNAEDYRNKFVDLVESHGSSPNINSPCIADLDGSDINFKKRPSKPKDWMDPTNEGEELDTYMKTYGERCDVAFLWTKEMNCYDYDKSYPPTRRIPPLERTCKSGKTFKLIARQVKRSERF